MERNIRTARDGAAAFPSEVQDSLPEDQLLLYAHLWELETWLREMVYTELVARYGTAWPNYVEGDARRAQEGDFRLSHMPTRERLSTSYILFSQLCATIKKRWVLFRDYLPPKRIWESRLDEVKQIRNRVAHFRRGHKDDVARVRQLMRDIDKGFWKFCTSYNAGIVFDAERDPVANEFLELDPFPWTEVEPNGFARIGIAPPDLTMSVQVDAIRRPWLKARHTKSIVGRYGYLYDLQIGARNGRTFDYGRFLQSTKSLHPQVCHIGLGTLANVIRITVPCVTPIDRLLPTLRRLVSEANNAQLPISGQFDSDELALKWPEHVLGPSNPLMFLDRNMDCSFFVASQC